MWPNPQETADLVTFTGEILNGKRSFVKWDLCVFYSKQKESFIPFSAKYWKALKLAAILD